VASVQDELLIFTERFKPISRKLHDVLHLTKTVRTRETRSGILLGVRIYI
jgi:hypothetical protein